MTEADDEAPAVVALVASAGGLEALTTVLEGLPADLPAAVVVCLHQNPERASSVPDLLGRRCALEVRHAVDDEVLRPGRVLVIPPGVHGLVRPDGRLALVEVGSPPPSRPSADLLLASMATAVGKRAVAVVLSGHGHDGATGSTAIHHLGGAVLAATEASSQFESMPRATADRDDAVDWVLGTEEIAAALADLLAGRPIGG